MVDLGAVSLGQKLLKKKLSDLIQIITIGKIVLEFFLILSLSPTLYPAACSAIQYGVQSLAAQFIPMPCQGILPGWDFTFL